MSTIIFEKYPEIENGNGNDQVNFGKSIAVFKFNDDNVLTRTVEELHIQGITCLNNEACTIIRGNTSRCPDDTDSEVTTVTPSNTVDDSVTVNTHPSTNEHETTKKGSTTPPSTSQGSVSDEATSIPHTTPSGSSSLRSHIIQLYISTLVLIMSNILFHYIN